MSRVAVSHPEKQGSIPGPSIFFLMGQFLWVCYTTIIVKRQLKSVWRNNFSGPGTIILKANFLYLNSMRKTLLNAIHGFSPVNVRLLTVCGTAFYAIIVRFHFVQALKRALALLNAALTLSQGLMPGFCR